MVNIITQSKGKKTCNGDAISNLYEKRLSTRSWAMGAAQTLALHWKQLEKNTYQISTRWIEKHQDKRRGRGADRPNILSTIG